VGAVVGGVVQIVTNVATGQDWNDGLGRAAVAGAASGALASSGVGVVGLVLGNATIAGGESIVRQGTQNGFRNIDWLAVGADAAVGGALGGTARGGLNRATANHLSSQFSRATSRVVGRTANGGIRAGAREAPRAARHFSSQTGKHFRRIVNPRDNLRNAGRAIAVNVIRHHVRR